jgi:hypothetical protein
LEDQANRFAANFLIPAEKYHKLLRRQTFSKEAIKQFADETRIAPGLWWEGSNTMDACLIVTAMT